MYSSNGCQTPLRIVVLAGGDSAEREVSLRSGTAVAAALAEAGHEVSRFDPAEQSLDELDPAAIDACFVALHGGAGEDGRLQAELARRDLPFTGSSSEACWTAMSKSASKRRFLACRVPTLPFALIGPADDAVAQRLRASHLTYPLIVKPDDQGSSIGIAVASCPAELAPAVATARAHGSLVLVEPLVRGREFTVALVDNRAFEPIEIVTSEPFFSYHAKYTSALTEYRSDLTVPPRVREALAAAARGAARALRTVGLVRVDLVLGADLCPWVLELNAVPGMTARSLAPRAARRSGIELPQLCDLLVRQCLTVGAA